MVIELNFEYIYDVPTISTHCDVCCVYVFVCLCDEQILTRTIRESLSGKYGIEWCLKRQRDRHKNNGIS